MERQKSNARKQKTDHLGVRSRQLQGPLSAREVRPEATPRRRSGAAAQSARLRQCAGIAKRSYPVCREARAAAERNTRIQGQGGSREGDTQVQGPGAAGRGSTPRPRSGTAGRSHLAPEVKGGSWEETHLAPEARGCDLEEPSRSPRPGAAAARSHPHPRPGPEALEEHRGAVAAQVGGPRGAISC